MKTLFDSHTCLRAVIDAGLERTAGEIHSVAEEPKSLRLDVGCYSIFGGDPNTAEALRLIETTAQGREMVYAGLPWKQRIQAVFPHAQDASMKTFIPGPGHLESARRLAAETPAEYHIRALSPEDECPDVLRPNGFQVHETRAAFFTHGFGFVATRDERVVALTSTYTVSSDKTEIAIATDPDHRNKGLAGSLAGAMLEACARKGLEPHWSASNPISQRLARRLGLVDEDVCKVLVVK
ncbi:MAG: GNAT family N-acetyltransferase [Acidobacteriota bacterium]|nr:GNAT family N-acetyltransferase [Acidobacteriota bacterium]